LINILKSSDDGNFNGTTCILHHLLINREPYKENDETPIKSLKLPKDKVPNTMSPDEMIKILSDAGYVISKPVMG